MKLSKVAVLSTIAWLGVVSVGCAAKNKDDGEGSLASTESQLVEDDAEAADTDDDLESGLDEPLSGASTSDPGSPAEGTTEADVLAKVRTNPGLFFQPAGCITTTITGNVATHVFKDCTGPWEKATFNGTVTSTYQVEPGKLTITHDATDFKINGATVSGKRTVAYTRSGSTISKQRTGSWSGTTKNGRAISHEASFLTTYDAAAKCITRDGTAKTSIGGRALERTIEDYKRCGIGRLGCPESGKLTLTATRDDKSISLVVEFLGGTKYRVTRPSGVQVTRSLICLPAR